MSPCVGPSNQGEKRSLPPDELNDVKWSPEWKRTKRRKLVFGASLGERISHSPLSKQAVEPKLEVHESAQRKPQFGSKQRGLGTTSRVSNSTVEVSAEPDFVNNCAVHANEDGDLILEAAGSKLVRRPQRWTISDGIGGRFTNKDPVFTHDEK
jgi:hypothetical protein